MKLSVIIASVFATAGFIVSLIAGLMVDNAFNSIVLKALLCCAICYAVGYVVGSVGQVISHEHARDLAQKVAVHDAKVAEEREAAARAAAAPQAPANA